MTGQDLFPSNIEIVTKRMITFTSFIYFKVIAWTSVLGFSKKN